MKRELVRLVRRLIDIASAIQGSVKAIHQDKHSDNDERDPPAQSDINAHVSLPVPITDYYASENKDGPGKISRDRIRLTVESATLIAAAVAAVFAFRSFGEVKRQADAAQKQVGIMQEQFEATFRPWLSINARVISPFTFEPDGAHISIHMEIKNVGNSPAVGVIFVPEVYLPPTFFGADVEAERKRLCADISKYAGDGIEPAIFQGAPLIEDEIFVIPQRLINDYANSTIATLKHPMDFIAPNFVVCVVYKSGSDFDTQYTTEAMYDIHRPGYDFKIGENVPLKDILFIPSPFRGAIRVKTIRQPKKETPAK